MVTKKTKKISSKDRRREISNNMELMENLLLNSSSTRRLALQQLLNPGLDIDYECHYPKKIDLVSYREMFDREGLGTRVCALYPDESWSMLPKIEENKKSEETSFEKEWKKLEKEKHLFHYLHRVDILSGIGHFGLLLLGVNDGKDLDKPVEGIDLMTGEKIGSKKYKLLYLKPLDESVVKIKKKEEDIKSARFGLPVIYEINFEDVSQEKTTAQKKDVHWTRVLHIVDNRGVSDINGAPRMKAVWNRLLDIRKVVSASGVMFWKGAYPGHALKLGEGVTLTPDQKKEMRGEITDYEDGLQRWLSLSGVEVQELKPQISDPMPHIKAHLNYVALTMGVPLRIFLGAEAGHLASDQDQTTWNKRIAKRQEAYISPMLIQLLIDRLMIYGVLSEVDEYFIIWPDLNAPGEQAAAEIASKKTEAYAKYVAGSVDELIPPREFFMIVMDLNEDEANTIIEAAMKYGEDLETKKEDEAVREGGALDDVKDRTIEIEKAKAKAKNMPGFAGELAKKKIVKKTLIKKKKRSSE